MSAYEHDVPLWNSSGLQDSAAFELVFVRFPVLGVGASFEEGHSSMIAWAWLSIFCEMCRTQ